MSDETGPARGTMFDSMAIQLVNAGINVPVAEFMREVRAEAGFRASPRQVSSALEGLSATSKEITAGTVAEVVKASRGDRSQRQRRNAEEWQALGTALTIQGQDGSPEGQREFIGVARQVAGPHATDNLLLQVSLILAGQKTRLNPQSVGLVSKRLAKSAQDLTPEQLSDMVAREYRGQRDQRRSRQNQRASEARRVVYPGIEAATNKPGKRRWKPGGRRRKTIKFPDQDDNGRRQG